MQREILILSGCLALSACGLGETAVSGAAGAAAQVEEAKQGLKTEARVKEQLDAAAQVEAQHRRDAEASAQ